ncbi:MAG: hypothetical protein COB20_09875 [SAR86 cluster bacterium]|uniref:ABC transporter permease n=1 Tax=SAR86 cluster bacterium TaxID=2030880 RepID=A0A2A4X2A8_9GAMM|nr:MAG: hypothetical protein COB20_09875 [SAR86 cluster bacterium]
MKIYSDLAFSLRLLRNTPVLTVMTVIVIVLGLSLYLASYSLVKMLSDKPMPFPSGDRYVTLKTINSGIGDFDFSSNAYDQFTYQRLKNRSENYAHLGAYRSDSFVLSDEEYSKRVVGASISAELFSALSIEPLLGRLFERDIDNSAEDGVVIISYSVWQDYYAGNMDIIGEVAEIDGRFLNVIGVMPEDFRFPTSHEVWFPLQLDQAIEPGRGFQLTVIGVLNPGVTHAAAELELNALLAELTSENPELYSGRTELVRPYASSASTVTLGFNEALTFITLIILMLGVLNLSSLLLIRSISREQEMAVRSSLGASNLQLAKQLLFESFLICSGGLILSFVALAVLLPWLGLQLENGQNGNLPFWYEFKLTSQVVLTGCLCTLAIWMASSSVVIYRVCRTDSNRALLGATKGGDALSRALVTRFTVGVEVILSCFLLVLCGAAIYFTSQITNTDYGVRTEQVISANFSLEHPDYETDEAKLLYLENTQQSITESAGVTNVAYTTSLPSSTGLIGNYFIEGRNVDVNVPLPSQWPIWVSENYFHALDVELIHGRFFTDSDNARSESVIIIDEVLAKKLWPDTSAIGKRVVSIVDEREQIVTVVGVISGILQTPNVNVGNPDVFYRPLTQDTPARFSLVATLQQNYSESDFSQTMRRIANQVDRNIPVENVQMLKSYLIKNQGGYGSIADLFLLFSIGTLLLATIGVYSVVARSVSERTSEIGIRRALGSTNQRIFFKFLKQSIRYLAAGIVLGIAPAAFIVGADPSVFLMSDNIIFLPQLCLLVLLFMAFLFTLASYVPARKAILLEPADALRYE